MKVEVFLVYIPGASLRGRPATLTIYSVKRTKVHDWLIVSANWRLENAKSPAAIVTTQTPHARV